MAGLVPAIHVFGLARSKTWMTGTSPGMTNEEIIAESISSLSRGRFSPEVFNFVGPPRAEGAGKAGRRRHPQPRVRKVVKESTRVELQVQPRHPGFPRAMALRLTSCSPR